MAHEEPIATEEPTIGKLVVDAFDDAGTLVRHIIELAKSELRVSVKTGVLGVVLLALAGFLSLLAIVMVSIAIALFVAMAGIDTAWAFLIVFGGYLLLAGLLALIGVLKIKRVRAPERTIAQAQSTTQALSHRA